MPRAAIGGLINARSRVSCRIFLFFLDRHIDGLSIVSSLQSQIVERDNYRNESPVRRGLYFWSLKILSFDRRVVDLRHPVEFVS